MHALVHYSHASRIWEEARLLFGINLPRLHPSTWARDILCDLRFIDKDRAIIITVMWAIWTSRNNITNDRASLNPIFSMKMTRETLALLDLPQKHAKILRGQGWRPREGVCVKINTDASLSMEARVCGLGGVARSAEVFLGAWCKPVRGVTDSLVAEALALREGLIFA